MEDGTFQARLPRLDTGHLVAIPLLLLLDHGGHLGWSLAALVETGHVPPDQL